MVGDADQSIYAFRGATIRNIVSSSGTSPTPRSILLEQNYRSTQNILAAANAVVSRNPGRKPRAVVRRGRRAADRRLCRGQRARRGRVRGRGGRPARRRGRGHARRGRGVLPHQRPVPGLRGSLHPGRAALQGGRRRPLLRAARGPGRARLPAADRQPRRRGVAAPDPQRAAARIGDRAEACVAALAQRERIRLRRAPWPGRPTRPGWPPRSAKAIEGVQRADGRPACRGRPAAGPVAELAEAVLDRTGYLAELQASDDLQDASRIENLNELVSVAREFDARPDPGRAALRARLPRAGVAGRRRRPDPRGRGARRAWSR